MSEKTDKIESATSNADSCEEGEAKNLPTIKNKPSEQERTKAWLVKALVIIFGSTIGGFLFIIETGSLFSFADKEDFKDILTSILIAETGIIGTALGFYFGSRSKN